MRAENYADTVFGAPTREPGNQWAFDYYLPRPIPRDLPMSPRLVTALSEADAALSRLDALSGAVDDPDVLAAPFLRREAVASTRLDGVRVSLAEVWQAGLDDRAYTQDVLAVQRYVEAAELACDLARELPITQRLILDVHRALLRDVVPEERRPGELRTSPVWIGAAEATPDTADFVTPLPVHLPDLLTDWERFVNDDGLDYPPLVQAALMHYQFATLHPFIDGNGRLGRLLITLLLVARGRLTHPLLDLSTALEARGRSTTWTSRLSERAATSTGGCSSSSKRSENRLRTPPSALAPSSSCERNCAARPGIRESRSFASSTSSCATPQ
ncbi:Fic family protein [Mobilicoccus sp.]|uniref:Fic family protein n=1 Tax=Mobilicoccus sp. TaxID=2034349 RepID=UPI0028B1BD22|nr:Fic family protein [Mobilicoccus sp.]